MRPVCAVVRLGVVVVGAFLLLLGSLAATREAEAQAGGTLVVGLDQEPPTLDPHASPSAVTYQIIASVTENLLYRGPDGKLVPWLAESWSTARDGKSVTFKLRRDVKFHDGTPFNAEAVKFNFDRIVDPKFKAGGARAALAGYAGSKVLDEYTVQVSFETPYAPFLNSAAAGMLSLVSPKAVRESGDARAHPPRRERAVHDQGVRRQGPRDDGEESRLCAEGALERPQRPRLSRRRRVEVRPRAGHAGDDAREWRDAGDLLRARPGAAPDREEPRDARREDAVAGRAAHLAAQRHEAADGRRAGAPRDQLRRRQGGLRRDGLQGHRPQGLRAAHRGDARRSRAAPGLSVRSRRRQGAAEGSGVDAGRGRHSRQGGAAARDRAQRHRVRGRHRPGGPAHPVLAPRGRHRREDQGAGAAALVRGQLPLRDARPGDVPALHRSRRPLLALSLVAGGRATSTGRA